MINLHDQSPVGIEPKTSWSSVRHAFDWAVKAGSAKQAIDMKCQEVYINIIFCSCLFVCVEVLLHSQPNGVMLSVVSLPNHTFPGQAYSSM